MGALSARAGVVARGDPVILEGTFGWAWMAQELQACGLEPHLCNGRKVDRWREAKGLAKTNRIDANLIRELWAESTRWWEVWRAEIGDLGRFASRKKLAAYAWLAPRAQDRGEETGATPVGRHVGHQGCRTLKWAFLEAAHGAVRKSAWMAAGFDRRTDGGRRDKNRGYLAVARPLCEIGYACQRKGGDCME